MLKSEPAELTFGMHKKILLLGSGELGKEVVIALQRYGQTVIAVDAYEGAPAMQVADGCEVINMLDGEALDAVVAKHQPDIIVPEVESIRTERFYDYEERGIHVVPSARAANFTMNRKAIRDLAAAEVGIEDRALSLRHVVCSIGGGCGGRRHAVRCETAHVQFGQGPIGHPHRGRHPTRGTMRSAVLGATWLKSSLNPSSTSITKSPC